MMFLYNVLLTTVVLLGSPVLLWLLLMPRRRGMLLGRLGWRFSRKPFGSAKSRILRPVWIHALSVGEVLSAEPIVARLRQCEPGWPIIFSATTKSGMKTARQLFENKVDAVINFPFDLLFSVRQAIRYVQPALVVIVETDIWPNFLWSLERRRIPALLVNARLSDRSFRGYQRLRPLMASILATLDGVGAQTEPDADRFLMLGARDGKVAVTGNVKFDQPVVEGGGNEGPAIRSVLGLPSERCVVIMGSTHPGEEEAGLQLLERVQADDRRPLLIIAPRDPARAEKVAEAFRRQGMRVGFLSELTYKETHRMHEVLVVNTIGLLRQLYSVADIAFVGGSLVPEGGHNPLEPAAAACPILFGPDMSDFKEISDRLVTAEAAVCVHGIPAFCDQIQRLMADTPLRKRMGNRAYTLFSENRGASQRILEMIRNVMGENKRAR